MRKLVTLLAATLLTVGLAQDLVFGITFDAGGKFDGSFNEGTFRGMERVIADLEADQGLEIDLLEFEGTPDTAAQGMRQIASEGAELIVSPGFLQADAIAAVSAEYPDTFFVLIDDVREGPNVRSVVFKEHEGSFLVGYIAGSLSQTGVVGFVGGMDIPLIRAFDLGFQEGVAYVCPDCTVISNYVGVTPDAWNDPTRAKELATAQQAQGADIIYAAAGASGNGVIDFVKETRCYSGATRETALTEALASVPTYAAYDAECGDGAQPLFFIGVDSNQNPFGDTDGDPATLNHGLTSMLKRVDVAAYNAGIDVANGTFTPGTVVLGLAEEGVGFARDAYNEALVPASLLTELQVVTDMIVSGQLEVTDYRAQ
ncbi:MAG: BMP family ABC transporter substrate-binding protein [Trueperaceae bacterium]|nr:BMP family ABC transporter substrate-binding protein [Trueperaceae bacterium]